MNDPEFLSIKINHSKPLELKRFTASMLCVENQYKSYLANEGIVDDGYDLFIHEIKQGSIIINFIKGISKKLIEHYVLESFVKIFGEKIESIVEQKVQSETGLSLKELKELCTISEVISEDYNSNMSFQVHVGDNITQNLHIDGMKANAVRNECLRQIGEQDKPIGEQIENAVLHWKQAGEDNKSLSIDKGVIEDVDPRRKIKLICSNELKQEMVSANDKNPFNMFFIVDVEIKRVSGKSVAYLITRIHDKGLIG